MADRRLLRRAALIVLVVATLLCAAGIFQHGLWTPDEPREAEIGREMLVSRFSALPTLGGEAFLEKPPLGAWTTAASYSVFGVSAGAARLPFALFAAGTIFVAYLLGKRSAGRLAGICSAVVLATMWQFAETSHKAVLDVELTFFVASGHLAFLALKVRCQAPIRRGEATTKDRCQAPFLYAAIGALAGLAFLTKSIVGPALMCAPPILAAAALRDWEYVKRVLPRAFVAAVLGVAAFGAPWVFALAHTPGGGWDAVKTCLVTNTIGRSVGGGKEEFGFSGHSHWFGYYLVAWVQVTAPWCLAGPAALAGRTLKRSWRGGTTAFCGLIFVAGLVLLSVPSGKRELYLLPLLPAAAVVPGVWLSRIGTRRGGALDVGTRRTLTVLALVALTAVVAATAVGAFWRPPSMKLPEDFGKTVALQLVLFVAPVLVVAGAARKRLPAAASGVRVAVVLVAFFTILQAAATPLLDPLRDMSAGAKEIADAVPADEKLLAWSADETTIAVVPYYSGRLLANLDKQGDVIRELDAGASKHLVVLDKDVKQIAPQLAARLDLVKTVRLSSTRDVNVYAVKK